MDLTEDEFNFIAAVITDEPYEYFLDENEEYSLFTDEEGDGYFMPSVTIFHTVDDEDRESDIIQDMLDELSWLNAGYVEIEADRHDNMAHGYFEPSSIDDDAREYVAERLD